MTVAFESGYTLPGGDLSLNHARILHHGKIIRAKTITASATATGSDGEEPNNSLTYEAWKPFDNNVPVPLNFGDAAYTATNLSVAADGQTITETGASVEHSIADAGTSNLTAVEWVFGMLVERQTIPEIQLKVNDTVTDFTCFFDLRDGTVGTAANATGNIVDLGEDQFYCSIRFTPAANVGTFTLLTSNGSETTTFTGTSTMKLLRADLNVSSATWDLETFVATAGDVFCIAGHNMGSRGGRLQFSYGSSPTLIGSVSPTDDSPIMFIHEGQTDADWRVTVDRAGGPEIAVIRVGKLLQMQRPFYQGFSPVHMQRTTTLAGNRSEGGQWLGRDIVTRGFSANYAWANLTMDWVRSNLDGRLGLIRSIETEPFFVAWRTGDAQNVAAEQDCDYVWTSGPVPAPSQSGPRNLATFSIDAQGYGHGF